MMKHTPFADFALCQWNLCQVTDVDTLVQAKIGIVRIEEGNAEVYEMLVNPDDVSSFLNRVPKLALSWEGT